MAHIWQIDKNYLDDHLLIKKIEGLSFSGREPLHSSLIDMLGDLSSQILNDPICRTNPQYVVLAYWLRKASIKRLCDDLFRVNTTGELLVPRGVALHLPPTNVDTIFVYSWAISVLAGNANIVRLSESLSHDAQRLVAIVTKVVAEHDDDNRQIFCNYGYGTEVEQLFAQYIDLRMIWGGDSKVNTVSSVPIRADGLSIGFPDRQSIALFQSKAYLSADENARNTLAINFFNDMFWFDQMGCGSPRVLFWLGDPGKMANDFYQRVKYLIQKRSYRVTDGTAIAKFVLANELLADGISSNYVHYGNALDVSRITSPLRALDFFHGGGFLSDCVINSTEELLPIINKKLQTITHFGFSDDELRSLAKGISRRGGFRIVPVGEALKFDTTWDGVELFAHMTRRLLFR